MIRDNRLSARLSAPVILFHFETLINIFLFGDRVFRSRSSKLERIDTGEYTPEEYERFLKEIRFVNRYTGDRRALKKSLRDEIKGISDLSVSVLDVGAGSGELLRAIAGYTLQNGIKLNLVGLDQNSISAASIKSESEKYTQIRSVQGDALELPFENSSFDFVICSLFTHHLTTDQIVESFSEMNRVASRRLIVIDLHRHPLAYASYKAMCAAFGISELVRHDGSLSILRGFKPAELLELGRRAGLTNIRVSRSFPFRLVLKAGGRRLAPIG